MEYDVQCPGNSDKSLSFVFKVIQMLNTSFFVLIIDLKGYSSFVRRGIMMHLELG